MTVGQFSRAIDGYNNKIELETKTQDQLNYILGQYIAAGVNDPSKYPKKAALSEDRKQEYSPESFRQMAKRRWGKKV